MSDVFWSRKARQESQIDLLNDEVLDLWEVIRELQALESSLQSRVAALESQQDKHANDLRELRLKASRQDGSR